MASKATWELVSPYFKPEGTSDKWGNPDAIYDELLLRLFDFRNFIKCPIYITRGVQASGHKEGSYHYPRKTGDGGLVGYAVDCVIPHYDKSPFDLVTDAGRFFNGIGYYNYWRYKGQLAPGLHIDQRPLSYDSDGTLDYRESRWMGIMGTRGKPQYLELSFENLLKYAVFPDPDEAETH